MIGYLGTRSEKTPASSAPKNKASVTILTGANYYDFPEKGNKRILGKEGGVC